MAGGGEIAFGRFSLNLGKRELLRAGSPVRLGSRAMEVLAVLASAKGEVVGKDELMNKVWPGVAVEENNLQVQISALRKALDEDNPGISHLVTVPGRARRARPSLPQTTRRGPADPASPRTRYCPTAAPRGAQFG